MNLPFLQKTGIALFSCVLLAGCAEKKPVLLNVQFVPQSPYAVWDPLHEEACEEMSLLMVHHYLENTPLIQANAEDEVQEMVAFETKRRYGVNVSMKELGEIAGDYYGYEARVLTDVTADALRRELDLGNPVIIPVAARDLHNPHFEGTNPFYHVIVVIGYSDAGFIVNEPGTSQGEQYFYTEDILMNALHDWTGKQEAIATGPKNALVLERLGSF